MRDSTITRVERDGRRRLFFGLRPSADCASSWLQGARLALGEPDWLRWQAPADVHLTIHFLGMVETAAQARLIGTVTAEIAGQRPFAIHAERGLWFPDALRPVVLAMSVTRGVSLTHLAARVANAVRDAGLSSDPRPFQPHITLARLRRRHPALPVAPSLSAGRFSASELILFESAGAGGPVRYHPCHVFRFTGSVSA